MNDAGPPIPKKPSLQVIAVEDSQSDAELLARFLAKAGLVCVIRRVQTEHDFLHELSDLMPDLILSDFSLPAFDGLRALELAVIHAPGVPFIYVSGTIGEERAIDALRRGAIDYVLKSNLSRLPSAIERALRETALKAAERESEQLRREQEQRLQRLTRTYRMLSSTSSAILRLRDRVELLDEVCRIAVYQGGYERVIISLRDSDADSLRPRASAASDADLRRPTDPLPQAGDSPTVQSRTMALRAIATSAPTVLNDLAAESQLPGDSYPSDEIQVLLARGYGAAATLPILIDGTPIGVITLLSTPAHVFDEPEIKILSELTANLSFALQYLAKDEAVHFLSYFDGLTGLAKRPLFCQRLAHLLSKPPLGGIRTVVVFDVQKLAAINDSFGRYAGDLLIQQIADRLKSAYTESEHIAHFGGGTFALTLATAAQANDTGRSLQNAAAQVFSAPFELHGEELRPVIRSGVACHPHDGNTAEVLVQNAETALKAAREENEKYKLYGLVTRHPTSRLALEARLSGALERGEFFLHYQPKVCLDNGGLEGFEALLRWRDAHDGLVPPSLFVPLLERSGAIVDVGEWVLMQAVHDIRTWFAAGLTPVRVAVNVSPLQLRHRDFVDRVLSSIEPASRLGAGGIDIEITESMLMQDLELSIRKLSHLREKGIGVAIDDFGTGYSSLCLLARLPVDTLKIDRSFVQALADSANGMTLMSTIVSLGHAFQMQTIAEGVETVQQLETLRLVKCDQAQGYFFGQPGPASDVPSVITRLAHPQASRIPAQSRKYYGDRTEGLDPESASAQRSRSKR
ncbi:MAG TPA: EAL domain-containing protein [Steroidobacteraceae bacterium]|jgi:diguanylate cyclase (GGDEF)-like protein|nr:EAL domain-containing protein [Steroidobacteraceae bacterium]